MPIKNNLNNRLNDELNRAIKNFNAKVKRLEKSGRDNIKIPNKVNKKDILNENLSNRDIRKEINSLKRFTKRGMENIVHGRPLETSKWEAREIDLARKSIERRLNKEIEEYEQTKPQSFGKSSGRFTMAQMGNLRYRQLLAKLDKVVFTKPSKLSSSQYRNFLNFIEVNKRTSLNAQFKANYIEMLFKNAEISGFDMDKVYKISNKLMKLSNREFLELFNRDSGVQKILDWYKIYKMEMRNGANVLDNDFEDLYDDYNEFYENLEEIL